MEINESAKVYKVDIAYEEWLYDSNSTNCSIQKANEWEYVYFICQNEENTILNTDITYKSSYLEHLSSLGFKIPSIVKSSSR